MAKDINIGGRLHSIATGNVIAGADEILDDNLGKKQTQINTETYSLVESVNNALDALNPDQQEALAVAAKANANEAKLGYYVCDTAAATAAKVIANATGYVLSAGGSIKIKMTNNNTADNATLNINSTGAKALYYAGERASSINTWEAGETVEVYYDPAYNNNAGAFFANNVAGGNGSSVKAANTELSEVDALMPMPEEYTRLEYIENTIGSGGAYIQTNLVPQDDGWEIEGSYYVKDWDGVADQPIYGNNQSYKANTTIKRYSTSNTGINYSIVYGTLARNLEKGAILNTLYHFKQYVDKNTSENVFVLNGIESRQARTGAIAVTDTAIQLFKSQLKDTSLIGGMGVFTARHNGAIVFKAIPARKTVLVDDTPTLVYGMYELVSQTFLTSETETGFVNSELNNI